MTGPARRADGAGHDLPLVQFRCPVPREDTPEGRAAAFWDALKRFLAERDGQDGRDIEAESERAP